MSFNSDISKQAYNKIYSITASFTLITHLFLKQIPKNI